MNVVQCVCTDKIMALSYLLLSTPLPSLPLLFLQSQVVQPGVSGDMYDVVHSDQPRHIPRQREEQPQPIPSVPGDLYSEVRNEPLHVPPGQPKGPYESGEDHSTL